MGVIIMLLGALLLLSPLAALLYLSHTPPVTATATATATAAEDKRQLAQAHAYDRRLLTSPNTATGEAADPFSDTDTPAWRTDRTYLKQLGAGDMMASISIPKISVQLRVGHGTSAGVLEQGAGHIYGTTLPVGDEGNTVIAAHRGLDVRLLFYRVGELGKGDMIYTRAAGRTVAWKVDWKRTVTPGTTRERNMLKSHKGRTLLTLYTCDPPGLNTRRLIVRAHRVPYNPTSGERVSQADWKGFTTVWTLGLAVLLLLMFAFSPKSETARHMGTVV